MIDVLTCSNLKDNTPSTKPLFTLQTGVKLYAYYELK